MNNHKLIQILDTFNKKEWREFSKFVESPYFNTDKHCIRLFKLLKREFVKKGSFQLSRASLEKEFSKDMGGASLLNVKLSLLTRLAEEFLVHQGVEQKPLLSKHILLTRLFKRGLNSHFESTYRRNSNLYELPEKVSPEYYLEKHLIQEDLLKHLMRSDKKTFLTQENMQATNKSLDIFYILKKIDLFSSMTEIERMFQRGYDFDSFQFIESIVMLPCYANHPIVRLYHAIYLLQHTPNSENFNHLMELLKKHDNTLSPFHLRTFYLLAANYCVCQVREGQNYHGEIHNIYVDMEKLELLKVREWTDVRTLQTVILSGLKLKKFEWTANIIEKYKNRIEPNIRGDTHNYFLALYAFYNKEFGKAISYLLKAGNVDYEFNMNIKSFLVKSYYEHDTEYSHHTEQAIRSYKVFFKQSKYFSEQTKIDFINFGNILNHLYRIKHHEGRATIEDVSKKMEQYEFIMYRAWLLEKIEELQNRPLRRVLY